MNPGQLSWLIYALGLIALGCRYRTDNRDASLNHHSKDLEKAGTELNDGERTGRGTGKVSNLPANLPGNEGAVSQRR